MKRYLLFVTAVVCVSIFHACGKDDEPNKVVYRTVGLAQEIHISDITGSHPDISDVAFVARVHMPPGVHAAPTGDVRVMLHLPFDRKETRLILPENPPQALLNNITKDIPEGFAISDTDANTISFVEIACNLDDTNTFSAFLYLGRTVGDTRYKVTYVYCDRPVTITGSGENWWGLPLVYDLSMQKGWNIVVEKTAYDAESQTTTVSNQMPNAIKWHYDRWIGGR